MKICKSATQEWTKIAENSTHVSGIIWVRNLNDVQLGPDMG